MKKLIFYFSICWIFSPNALFGQPKRTCATQEYMIRQLANDPSFARKQQEIESATQVFMKRASIDIIAQKGIVVYTIPVVVHVVYNTAAQNISDAQVQSQMDVLNKDYQFLNADTSKIPTAFKGLAADCQIKFCLAMRKPDGSATNGIVRKSTTATSFATDDKVKRSANGGDDAWDATKYLNLWVCNLSGGILGYAQFPGGGVATDGVVITYTGFGVGGTAVAPYNIGRTATHEVGHWLNLRHIWGDDGTACTGSDLVDDTPNQADENYGCPVFPSVSCSNGPSGDMFMDYMDYTDDACMYMFTNGQKSRMYALFSSGGARAAIVNNNLGCSPTSTTGCAVPASLTAANITATSAAISWTAVSGAPSYSLQYKVSSASTYTTVVTSSPSYNLTGLTAATVYNYQVRANCTMSSGAYTATQNFTTQAGSCIDIYEPNNTSASAATVPVNATVSALIASTTDIDYFKFNNMSTQKNIKVTLSNLPFDYDVILYSPSGTQVAASENSGTSSEAINYNTSVVGTYKVKVSGYQRAYSSTSCYLLGIGLSASAVKEQERVPNEKTVIKVSPSPASSVVSLSIKSGERGKMEIVITSQSGEVILRRHLSVNEGMNTEELDVSRFKNGLYFIKISQGKVVGSDKLVVQH